MTTQTNKLHFLEAFEARKVHRSQINPAPYNPRVIDKINRDDLGRTLRKLKLCVPLVWNEQTGNLVGGHQRLDELDTAWKKKFKTEDLDYELTLSVVNIPLKEEIELNIALNNPNLMGDYDAKKMNELLSSETFPDIDLKVAGITDYDLEIWGITEDLQNLNNTNVEEVISQFEEVKEQKKREITPEQKEERKASVKSTKKEQLDNQTDTYVTLSFSNQKDKRAFMKKIGEPEGQLYIKGEAFDKKFFS